MLAILRCVILLSALGLLVACKAAPASTTRPSESQLADERARVAKGEKVGETLKSPAIAIDSLKLSVNDETVAAGAISVAQLAPLRAHLDALRDHWTKIHPGQPFAGAPAVTIAPQVSADLALACLRTLVEAEFPSAKVTVGAETIGLDLAPPGPASFDVIEVRAHDVTTWVTWKGAKDGKDCNVIVTENEVADFAKLPPHFELASLAGSSNDVHVIIRPGSVTTAGELLAPLRHLMASPLLVAHHGKLRFEWAPVFCPPKKRTGDAN